MNLSHAYGAPVSAEQGERVLLAALDARVTHFDTAALYGFGANEAWSTACCPSTAAASRWRTSAA